MHQKLTAAVLNLCEEEKVYRKENILAIVLQLSTNSGYTNATTLWLALKADGNKISIASVYRILHWLTLKGLILRKLNECTQVNEYRVDPEYQQ